MRRPGQPSQEWVASHCHTMQWGCGVRVPEAAGDGAGCNTVSTAEQAVLCILSVVRNYPAAHRQIVDGRWDLAEASSTAYDLEGKHVGCALGSQTYYPNPTPAHCRLRTSTPPRTARSRTAAGTLPRPAALLTTWRASTSGALYPIPDPCTLRFAPQAPHRALPDRGRPLGK